MTDAPPIRKLMVTAGQCALRCAPLPREIRDKLRANLDQCTEDVNLSNPEYLLVEAGHAVLDNIDSTAALDCFNAARRLVAEKRAAAALPGTPEARPDFWWQREGLGG